MAQSPLRHQYESIKARYPGAIVLFRLGDFYETFDEDAHLAARELEIVLTSREMGKGARVPMAGIPAHALESYLAKLIARGHKVAICEQLTDPKVSKGLVDRDVIRVVTPGTVVEPALLQGSANNFLVAVFVQGGEAGLAYVDITTSEFATAQLSASQIGAELQRLAPAELLAPRDGAPPITDVSTPVTTLDPALFDVEAAGERLLAHFGAPSLEPYGCEDLPLATAAAGAALAYLQETQRAAASNIQRLTTYSLQGFMPLDLQTVRNLELFQGAFAPGDHAPSLLATLDLTETPMGSRLLRRWLGQPLLDIAALRARQAGVAWLTESSIRRGHLRSLLHNLPDVERLVNRVRSGTASPREVVTVRRALDSFGRIAEAVTQEPGPGGDGHPLAWAWRDLRPHREMAELIGRALQDDPGPLLGEGATIRPGFSPELDALRDSSQDARDYIARMEAQERQRTGISSLKVGYNKVFGYYIEVTRPNLSRVPAGYIRKQTIANGERFFTPELKEYEAHILHAQERMEELETALFRQVCRQVGDEAEAVLESARAVARLDVLAALAEAAVLYGYTRPDLDEGDVIEIAEGRHPVVERALSEPFIPNDTLLSHEKALAFVTGPNMSGKSTYLRQVALIVLMAQVGSFVPAKKARIGLVDRIFTRIGLHDDLSLGRSTFMVEMMETAHILHQATPRSLIVLDEIGRGTSTYDGLAIAWAVAEYIHNHPRLGSRTLFATHYHELVELGELLPRAVNLHVVVAEEEGKVVFLRKVLSGGADRSYGVHVAQLAGLPRATVSRAEEVLARLEGEKGGASSGVVPGLSDGRPTKGRGGPASTAQAPLFALIPQPLVPSPVEEELRALDLDGMTPIEALTRLYELQKKARSTHRRP
ncbi:MAG: DNA mismatch repair protein MutS [Chloroflexi bacterium]|nr:DNA mismatch repair protein MutS [Chloroflexota bacterium]